MKFTSLSFAVLLGSYLPAAAADDTGHAQFLKYGCWQCHGTEGQGTSAGPKLAPDPLPYEGFSAFVRSSSRQMPPFREQVLPEPDLQAIHAYLSSRPAAVDVKKIIDP
ncbi:cytochrome c [Beijerinckia sp. GAS462]|uniref:c-type cytochrome n=1 Tax=Beijerinckia sp. GAS462 TaxID=3039852 RepID=UPI0014804F12|nr:cytochrome c [Beijerinckia sp. GAS462]